MGRTGMVRVGILLSARKVAGVDIPPDIRRRPPETVHGFVVTARGAGVSILAAPGVTLAHLGGVTLPGPTVLRLSGPAFFCLHFQQHALSARSASTRCVALATLILHGDPVTVPASLAPVLPAVTPNDTLIRPLTTAQTVLK